MPVFSAVMLLGLSVGMGLAPEPYRSFGSVMMRVGSNTTPYMLMASGTETISGPVGVVKEVEKAAEQKATSKP